MSHICHLIYFCWARPVLLFLKATQKSSTEVILLFTLCTDPEFDLIDPFHSVHFFGTSFPKVNLKICMSPSSELPTTFNPLYLLNLSAFNTYTTNAIYNKLDLFLSKNIGSLYSAAPDPSTSYSKIPDVPLLQDHGVKSVKPGKNQTGIRKDN